MFKEKTLNRKSNSNYSKNSNKRKGKSERSPKAAHEGKRKRNPRRRNRGGDGHKPQGIEKFYLSYQNLLERHLEARKKYFELYHRADPRQLEKLERNFYRTLDELRKHEASVKPELEEQFKSLIDGLSLDDTYSKNHGLPLTPEPPSIDGPVEDPHLLPSQTKDAFNEDTEESIGTIDDYIKYKDL